MSLVEEATAIAPGLIELRRELHQVPEVGLDLPKTQALVLDAVAGLPLEISTGKELTSVVGVLRGGQPGPTVLLQGDMDALPVVEETGLAYAAENGNMHACGHDLHTTGLVGAAKLLSAHRDELNGNVIFMFQPGEEGLGGAGCMLREGLLSATGDKPIAAYALRLVAGGEGTFQLRPGTIMASSNQLHITVHGKGGHGSSPDRTIDPVPVVAELVLALQTYATRRVNVFDPVVITVTQLEAGVAINVIPNTARLGATVRTLSDAMLEQLTRELAGTGGADRGGARMHGRRAARPAVSGDGERHRPYGGDRGHPHRPVRCGAGAAAGQPVDGRRGLLDGAAGGAGHVRDGRRPAGRRLRGGRSVEPFEPRPVRRRGPRRPSGRSGSAGRQALDQVGPARWVLTRLRSANNWSRSSTVSGAVM